MSRLGTDDDESRVQGDAFTLNSSVRETLGVDVSEYTYADGTPQKSKRVLLVYCGFSNLRAMICIPDAAELLIVAVYVADGKSRSSAASVASIRVGP